MGKRSSPKPAKKPTKVTPAESIARSHESARLARRAGDTAASEKHLETARAAELVARKARFAESNG